MLPLSYPLMKKLLPLLFWLLCACPSIVRGQVMPFTHYTPDSELNALPSAEVHKVFQDSDGFIWMAIFSSGLVRYDGHQMERYGVEDGLRDLAVWDITEDPAGRLWVASNAGLVVSEEPLAAYTGGRKVRFTSVLKGKPLLDLAVSYNRMAIDAQGWLWVGTDGKGIFRYYVADVDSVEVDTLRVSAGEPGTADIPVRALTVRQNGSVWVALLGGGLAFFPPGSRQSQQVDPPDAIAGTSTNALHETAGGVLWGGRQDGAIWRMQENARGRQFSLVHPGLGSNVSSFLSLSDATLWASTEGAGILQLSTASPYSAEMITPANGLLRETVYHLTRDREGNIWIAQSGGVSKLRYNFAAFKGITSTSVPYGGEQPLLPSPSVNAVLLGRGGNDPCGLWAGTQEAGLACITGATSAYVQKKDGLVHDWVNGLAYDEQGRLWIGSARGANSLSFGSEALPAGVTATQRVEVLGRRARLSSYRFASVLSVSTARIKAGVTGSPSVEVVLFPAYHALYCLVGNDWFTLGAEQGLPLAVLNVAALDGEGRLWVGTRDQGLYRSAAPVTLEALRSMGTSQTPTLAFERIWSTDSGAPSNLIESLRWHRDLMWIGTPEGLVAMDSQTLRVAAHLTIEDGLLANNAVSMAVSPATGHLWVGTNAGLAAVDPDARQVVRTVTKQDGLIDNEVWFYGSVTAGEDGTIYYGTAKGIAIYQPALDQRNLEPPLLRLRTVEQHRNATGRGEISFEYAGLSFSNERQVRYRTRLIGYDTDWSPPVADVKLRYTNLTAFFLPKAYTFQVMAANESGVWTESPLTYSFKVAPRWWLRWWAFIGFALLLAGGIVTVVRMQHHRVIMGERQRAREREQTLRLEAAEALANYLNADNERKTEELESARQLQLAMLPTRLPEHPTVEVAAYMSTATEVGGDYYDFHVDENGTLTLAIGDATGHGAAAGTVVTVTKSLFMLLAGEPTLEQIIRRANGVLKEMRLKRFFMAIALARVNGYSIEFIGAGMPPALVYRAGTGKVEEIALKGMPLGGVANFPYRSTTIEVAPGDAILLMSDGFPEMFNEHREMLGYDQVEPLFAAVAHESPEDVIAHLMRVATQWLGTSTDSPDGSVVAAHHDDDLTFVALKVR